MLSFWGVYTILYMVNEINKSAGGNKMENTNYMQRFVSETVINEALEAYDTMVATRGYERVRENEAAGMKFYGMEREVVAAIRDAAGVANDFLALQSDEHKLVLFRIMTRMIEDGSLQLN